MLFPYRLSFVAQMVSASLSASLITSLATPALAQSPLPACPPPTAQEFLLLVRGETEADRNKIATILPENNTVLVCQYLDETLVRAGGFTSLETANAWASYMTTVEGFESFVSRPDTQVVAQTAPARGSAGEPARGEREPLRGEPAEDEPVRGERVSDEPLRGEPASSSSAAGSGTPNGTSAYQPRRLESGYAVLVSYGSQPEIAATVSQIVRPVGLAVYREQAYLLADYTSDAASAAEVLQRLSDAQLSAILVDAQQVVRISVEVAN
jgi:hypothetical protein